jgi:uncharacterized protein YndB with AHSA1/START domain
VGSYRFEVHINAPPELVFALWTDLDRTPEWVGGVARVTDVSGPLDQPGTRFIVHFGRMKSPTEVLDVERPRRFKTSFGNAILKGENSATFEPDGEGTRLTQELRTRGLVSGFFGRIFAAGSYKGSFRGELMTFKQLAERVAAARREYRSE